MADELNVTSAKRLNISQPPLSCQIKDLEEELKVALSSRIKRRLQLTEAGRFLYQRAKHVLASIEELQVATKRVHSHGRPWLNIGYLSPLPSKPNCVQHDSFFKT